MLLADWHIKKVVYCTSKQLLVMSVVLSVKEYLNNNENGSVKYVAVKMFP